MTDERGSGTPAVPGRAPRAKGLEAPRTAQQLVDELVGMYREQVRRALSVDLDDTPTSLAFVDHHLSTAEEEGRTPILSLLAASAGAYYGELVRKQIGGTWIGDGKDPRRLRMLMKHQFIYFSPIDQALEAIAGESLDLEDARLADAEHFDTAFRLRPLPDPPEDADEDHDAVWLTARLSELSEVPEDQFVTLTCRFETLTLMHEFLATKHASEGREPVELGVEDYLGAIAREAQARATH
jgi:hypothetical protein